MLWEQFLAGLSSSFACAEPALAADIINSPAQWVHDNQCLCDALGCWAGFASCGGALVSHLPAALLVGLDASKCRARSEKSLRIGLG